MATKLHYSKKPIALLSGRTTVSTHSQPLPGNFQLETMNSVNGYKNRGIFPLKPRRRSTKKKTKKAESKEKISQIKWSHIQYQKWDHIPYPKRGQYRMAATITRVTISGRSDGNGDAVS